MARAASILMLTSIQRPQSAHTSVLASVHKAALVLVNTSHRRLPSTLSVIPSPMRAFCWLHGKEQLPAALVTSHGLSQD